MCLVRVNAYAEAANNTVCVDVLAWTLSKGLSILLREFVKGKTVLVRYTLTHGRRK